MRILYVATDQVVPGHTGGSVHVLEVARGLARRGHDVHAVVDARSDEPRGGDPGSLHWHRLRWRPHHRLFRFRARRAVRALARDTQAQVVMERYYNFGGEGVGAAADLGLPSLLEVNSPLLDHPGSWKGRLDGLLLFRPMRRYREQLCRRAAALVSPLPGIVPEFARSKTRPVTWGANVETFRPEVARPQRRKAWGAPADALVALFSGSFRPWHGVHVLEEAARLLASRSDLYFVLAGGERAGPGTGYRGRRLGTVPYEDMPEVVASADIGVAPYDTTRLGQLRLGFYWSPLKVFEYMAAGLPTVTIAEPPLAEVVRHEREGLLVPERDPGELARAIVRLAEDHALRRALGAAARARVVERYSWARHCADLEAVLLEIAS
jgi:glycosyltransferase involved in cell wall biosynthesis